jgi:hypothetical protein
MGYCRFRNTEMDLRDCINHLDPDLRDNWEDEELSMEEEMAARRMIRMMLDFLYYADIIQEEWYDGQDEAIEELFRRGDSDQYSA